MTTYDILRLDCGCFAWEPEPSQEPEPPITLCPLHAAAPALLVALEAASRAYHAATHFNSKHVGGTWDNCDAIGCSNDRVLIAAAKGE